MAVGIGCGASPHILEYGAGRNRVRGRIEKGRLDRGRDHWRDMLLVVAVFALLCSGIRRSVYF
jgi:hypothetical protein